MMQTYFVPAKHGFKFSNNDIEWEIFGFIRGHFLCGGMVYAALDYFGTRKPIPSTTTPTPVGTPLNDYIHSRQSTAHGYTVRRLVASKVALFFTASREQWFVDSLASEFDKIRSHIAGGKPVPLFLVKDGFTGHHVLVIGCASSPSIENPILLIYDPNRPGDIGRIFVDYQGKKLLNSSSSAASGTPMVGFFVDPNYTEKTPPDIDRPVPPPGPTPPGPRPPGPAPSSTRTYVVQRGDSLSAIAKKHYGDGSKWPTIYAANKTVIGPNPNLIRVGQTLTIP